MEVNLLSFIVFVQIISTKSLLYTRSGVSESCEGMVLLLISFCHVSNWWDYGDACCDMILAISSLHLSIPYV